MTYDRDLDELKNANVLIVEEDPIVGTDLAHSIANAGGTIFGPVARSIDLTGLLKFGQINCAVLNMDSMNVGVVFTARLLQARAIPFVLHCAGDFTHIEKTFANAPIVAKGSSHDRIVAHLIDLTWKDEEWCQIHRTEGFEARKAKSAA